jgi:hypothetical protein
MQSIRIRFPAGEPDVLSLIEIDAPLAIGGPETSWRALAGLRLQIVSAQFRVTGDRLFQKLHVSELDGEPLEPSRAQELWQGLRDAFGQRRPLPLKGPRRAIARPPEARHPGDPSNKLSAR